MHELDKPVACTVLELAASAEHKLAASDVHSSMMLALSKPKYENSLVKDKNES